MGKATAIFSHKMGRNSTGTSASGARDGARRRPGRRRAAAALALLLALLLAVGCSTARRRGEPDSLAGSLRQRDPATTAFFAEVYRSGSVYVDFRPVLVADAVFEDRRYRELFVQALSERLLLDAAQRGAVAAEQARGFSTRMEFLLFVYDGTNRPVRLNRPDSPWKVALRDDDGQLLQPAAVEPVKPDSPTYRFLETHFDGLDRWSRPFRVAFPKLPKGRLGQPPGPHPVQLIVTGLSGTVTMTWADAGLFYRTPAGEAGRSAGGEVNGPAGGPDPDSRAP